MREIKFRAWVKKAMRMATWETIKKECDRLSLLENDDFIFMQYTGIKDKNGVEIYEGDIIKGDEPEMNDCVVYDENRYILKILDDDCIYWEKCEVIGNIHQNPELIWI